MFLFKLHQTWFYYHLHLNLHILKIIIVLNKFFLFANVGLNFLNQSLNFFFLELIFLLWKV